MPTYAAVGSSSHVLSNDDMKVILEGALVKVGSKSKVCLIPPDFTRLHSRSGDITRILYHHFGADKVKDIIPALGTHKVCGLKN